MSSLLRDWQNDICLELSKVVVIKTYQVRWAALFAAAFRQGLIRGGNQFDWVYVWHWTHENGAFLFFHRHALEALFADDKAMFHLRRFGFDSKESYENFKLRFIQNLRLDFPDQQGHTRMGILLGYPLSDVLAHETHMKAKSVEEYNVLRETMGQNLVYFDKNEIPGFKLGGYSEYNGGSPFERERLQYGTREAITRYQSLAASGASPLEIFNRLLESSRDPCPESLTPSHSEHKVTD